MHIHTHILWFRERLRLRQEALKQQKLLNSSSMSTISTLDVGNIKVEKEKKAEDEVMAFEEMEDSN